MNFFLKSVRTLPVLPYILQKIKKQTKKKNNYKERREKKALNVFFTHYRPLL